MRLICQCGGFQCSTFVGLFNDMTQMKISVFDKKYNEKSRCLYYVDFAFKWWHKIVFWDMILLITVLLFLAWFWNWEYYKIQKLQLLAVKEIHNSVGTGTIIVKHLHVY